MVKQSPVVESVEVDLTGKRDAIPFLRTLKQRVDTDINSRAEYLQRLENNYNQRFALVDRDINYPWPGASDIVMPMSDALIDRLKPSMLGLITKINPIVSFQSLNPASIEAGRKNEVLYHWLWHTRAPDNNQQVAYAIDSMLQHGKGVLASTYEYRTEATTQTILRKHLPDAMKGFMVLQKGTVFEADLIRQLSRGQIRPITREDFDRNTGIIEEAVKRAFNLSDEEPIDRRAIDKIMKFLRSGQKEVEVSFREERTNCPRTINVELERLIVPAWTTTLRKAERLTHRLTMSVNELFRSVSDEGFDEKAVERVVGEIDRKKYRGNLTAGSNSVVNEAILTREEREGLSYAKRDEIVDVDVKWAYYDYNGDGVEELVVAIGHPDFPDDPFKFIANPFAHGRIPYSEINFEMNEARYHSSRGVVEKIKDLETEMTWQHREKLNSMRISNSPLIGYVDNSNFNPAKLRFIPGESFRVRRQGDVFSLPIPDRSPSFEREELLLRNFIETYVGSPDVALTSLQGGAQTSRTATEISLIQELTQVSLGFHGDIFQLGMKEVHSMNWSNWVQLGPEEVTIAVTGKNPMRFTRYQIQGQFDLVPRGTAGNTNPAIEEQKAFQRMQILSTMVKPILDADPKHRFEADLAVAAIDWMQRSDLLMSDKLIRQRSPEEIAQIVAAEQKEAAEFDALRKNQPMSLERAAQLSRTVKKNAPHGADQKVDMPENLQVPVTQ